MTVPISTAPEYAWIVEEAAFATPLTTGLTIGTNQFLIPLVEGDSFSGNEDPVFTEIASGGGWDVPGDLVADSRMVKISLKTLGYPALAAFLANAAVTRINAGQTSPYATTEPPFDLASFTLYHAIRARDGAWQIWGYPGCKVAKLAGSVSRQDPKLKLSLDIVGTKEFPNEHDSSTLAFHPDPPADTAYPKGPYTFSHTGGNVLMAGSALAQYDSLDFSISNKLDPQACESEWVQSIQACGRESESNINLILRSTADLRSTYQAATSQGYSLKFNNGTNSLKFDFNGNNYINKLPNSLPLGKTFFQKASFRNKWDATAGADVSIVAT